MNFYYLFNAGFFKGLLYPNKINPYKAYECQNKRMLLYVLLQPFFYSGAIELFNISPENPQVSLNFVWLMFWHISTSPIHLWWRRRNNMFRHPFSLSLMSLLRFQITLIRNPPSISLMKLLVGSRRRKSNPTTH